MGDRGLIYDVFPNDGPTVVNITGTQIGFNLSFAPDSQNMLVLPVGDAQIPQAANSALQMAQVNGTPVLPLLQSAPQFFDTLWTQNVVPTIGPSITSQLDGAFGAGKYTSTTPSIPSSGQSRARVLQDGTLMLDYWVSNINFKFTTKFGPLKATFQFNTDAELLLYIFLQWPTVYVNPSAQLLNVKIKPTSSATAAAYAAYSSVEPQAFATLGDMLAYYEGVIQASPPAAPDVSALATAFAALSAAAVPLGLLTCSASVSQSAASPLTFTMTHQIDAAPEAYNTQTNAGVGTFILGGPVLAASQTQVVAASTINITGSQFPPSTSLGLGWTDTCSGVVVSSNITYGPEGQGQTTVTIPRPVGSAPIYVLPLTAQTAQYYQMQVSDLDALTTTPPSDVILAEGVGSFDLLLSYTSNAPPLHLPGHPPPPTTPHPVTKVLTTVNAKADGTFSTPVVIPPDAVPGPAALQAQMLGAVVASIPLTIVTTVQPALNLYAPSTGAVQYPSVVQGLPVYVHGEGFAANHEVHLYIDNAASQSVGSKMVGADQTFDQSFPWPWTLLQGQHSVIAVEKYGGMTVQATLMVTQQATEQ